MMMNPKELGRLFDWWCVLRRYRQLQPHAAPFVADTRIGKYREGEPTGIDLLPGQHMYVTRYGDGSFDIDLGS